MNVDQVNTLFEELINQRGVHNQLGLTSDQVRNYRRELKGKNRISLDLKIQLLQKAGIPVNAVPKEFTKQDLQDFAVFLYKEKVQYEPEYAVHKFLLQRKHAGTPPELVNDPIANAVRALIKNKK